VDGECAQDLAEAGGLFVGLGEVLPPVPDVQVEGQDEFVPLPRRVPLGHDAARWALGGDDTPRSYPVTVLPSSGFVEEGSTGSSATPGRTEIVPQKRHWCVPSRSAIRLLVQLPLNARGSSARASEDLGTITLRWTPGRNRQSDWGPTP
jgi:hypothetical protein